MIERVLSERPCTSLDTYVSEGGGAGLSAARQIPRSRVIDEVQASGLRGRGGAGFPTGVKWRTVSSYASTLLHTTVVVNAAEGEPGTFKDRAILRSNPYRVLEGALIAAWAMDARSIVVATKATFTVELARLRSAIDEITSAGWCDGVDITITEGPGEYLFGEETALLEVVDGRPPFPRLAPPFRQGVVSVVGSRADAESGSGLSAPVQMAGPTEDNLSPPALVNNVETLANIPAIIALGADWFREVGTALSPGTIVCTVTGAVARPGVAEVPMGTTLRAVLDAAGGGLAPEITLRAVLNGVSGAIITPDLVDVPLTYESMDVLGRGLGSASFIVIGDDTEPLEVAAGIARFLSIESCGQCTHCKQDGASILALLDRNISGAGEPDDLTMLRDRLDTVADGARCSLASQQSTVIGSFLVAFPHLLDPATPDTDEPRVRYPIATLSELGPAGAVIDVAALSKNPDWSHGIEDSGKTPVDRFLDHRAGPEARSVTPVL